MIQKKYEKFIFTFLFCSLTVFITSFIAIFSSIGFIFGLGSFLIILIKSFIKGIIIVFPMIILLEPKLKELTLKICSKN